MAYYMDDGKGNLVPVKGDIPEEAILAIEKYDDETIVRSMTSGIAAEAYIYRYTIQTAQGPKELIGIGSTGSDQLANLVGNLEVLNDARIDKDSDPDYVYVMLRVKNLDRNVVLLGVGRACKFMVGAGNKPIKDRLDEFAFVKAVSKAQRNGVLHHVSEEVVTRIINEFAKRGKQARINPPAVSTEKKPLPTPTPAKPAPVPTVDKPPPAATGVLTAEAIAAQQQKILELRSKVHDRFTKELGVTDENIKTSLKNRFGTEQLTELSEAQLNECLTLIDNAIARSKAKAAEVPAQTTPPPATTTPPAQVTPPITPPPSADKAVSLGFADADEQTKIRGRLYTLLTNATYLGMTTNEAKAFVAQHGFANTADAPKDKLNEMITEATEMVEAKNNPPPSTTEEMPF